MKKTAAYPFWRKRRSSSTRIAPGGTRRILGDGGGNDAPLYPLGSTQGSVSAMGYSQSWTMGSGSAGELYLSKLEKKLLGVGDRIGARSPLEGLCDDTRD